MKTDYKSGYELWLELQPDGKLDSAPTSVKGIWKVTDKVSGDFGYVFVDETECFYPQIYRTVIQTLKARSDYILHELG